MSLTGCLRFFLPFVYLVSAVAVAAAEDFRVKKVDAGWVANVYQLTARLSTPLSPQTVEALHRGITLPISVDIELARKRRYWLDEEVAQLEQRYLLRYHALADQYVLTNVNSGVQHNFPSLQTSLDVLGTIVDLPILDRHLLTGEEKYFARMRVRLDIDSLPAPLRVQAYFLPGWRLASEWYKWKLKM